MIKITKRVIAEGMFDWNPYKNCWKVDNVFIETKDRIKISELVRWEGKPIKIYIEEGE
jgi:hypothetical protein